MKTKLLFVLVIVLVLLSACNQQKDKLPDESVAEAITTYAPLPSFKTVFQSLDQFTSNEINAVLPNTLFSTKQEDYHNAYALGVLTADATLAAKAKNKAKLTQISTQMMNLTTLIGLESEVNQLGDQISSLIKQEKWADLETALDQVKQNVESKLWEKENFELYTMMILGGWTEAANRVSVLVKNSNDLQKSGILKQEGTWKSLVANMQQIKAAELAEQDYFKTCLSKAIEFQSIIESSSGTFNNEQLVSIITVTDAIHAAVKQ